MGMVFRPRPGFRFATSAQQVGERIEQIKESLGGEVTPEAVVEDARPKSSPLHDEFGELWDDRTAADLMRRQRAQTLIGSYLVVMEEKDLQPREVLGNIIVTKRVDLPDGEKAKERVYVSSSVAMANPEYRQQVFQEAMRYLNGAKERLRLLADVNDLVAEIERINAEIKKRSAKKKMPA